MTTISEVWIPSPHYSTSRGPYNKIVFHTTEGAMRIRDLGSWFQNPSAQCSSHHGADNYEAGVFGAYVYENYKAWTQGNANPYCLSIELCAYASWSRDTWLNSKATLVNNAAQWLSYMVGKYGIPWTVLSNSQAQDPNVRGICQHVNFGSWGSGHHDCGSGFPMDVVLDKARNWGGSRPPETVTPPKGMNMSSASAFDYVNRLHFAAVNQRGEVCYKGPAGNWYPISTDAGNKALSGLAMAICPPGTNARWPNGDITITFTRDRDDNVCTWQKGVDDPGQWVLTARGGSYQ